MRAEVVWWSDTGKVLHRDPDCPPFVRARYNALAALASGDMERGTAIRSYDFAEDTSPPSPYPPQRMTACRRCYAGERASSKG
jgi:hypothetical protein